MSRNENHEPLNTRTRVVVPTAPKQESTRFANMAMGLDAMFCNIVGLVFTLTGAFMSDWLGVAGWLLTLLGVIVLLWSFVVTLFANRRVSKLKEIDFVIKVNVVAIVGLVAAALLLNGITSAGQLMFGAGAAVVAGFTIAQLLARRTLV